MAEPEEVDSEGRKIFNNTRQPSLENREVTIFYPTPQPILHCPYPDCDVRQRTVTNAGTNGVAKLVEHLKAYHQVCSPNNLCHFCLVCGNKFVIIARSRSPHECLKLHVGKKDDVIEFICNAEECGKVFYTRETLRRHQKNHSETKALPKLKPHSKKNGKKKNSTADNFAMGSVGTALQEDTEVNEEEMEDNEEETADQPEEVFDFDDEGVIDPEISFVDYLQKKQRQLTRILNRIARERVFTKFEEIVSEIVSRIQREFKINTNWYVKQWYQQQDDLTQSELRKLYDRNPKRAISLVTNSAPVTCNLPLQDIENHFVHKFENVDLSEEEMLTYFDKNLLKDETTGEPRNIPPLPLRYFTAKEVLARLKRFKNTAPGPDKLQYKHWLQVDPDGNLLWIIYNICLKYKRVPKSWKESRTFLYPKKDNPEQIQDWRPISLLNTIYKLYSALLADRITEWCDSNGIIDPAQKGSSSHDVILEHTYVLKYNIKKALESALGRCFGIYDIESAFQSMLIKVVLASAKFYNCGDGLSAILTDLFSGRITLVVSGNGTTEPIQVRVLLTGDPISMVLFKLVLNVAIKGFLRKFPPSSILRHCILVTVDDIATIARNAKTFQDQLNFLSEYLAKIGLLFSPSKCLAVKIKQTRGEQSMENDEFSPTLNDHPIKVLCRGESFRYLGVKISSKAGKSDPIPPTLMEYAETIMGSKLTGFQKIAALRTYILPKINHELRLGNANREQWREFDDNLRRVIKKALNLPESAPNCYIYGSKKMSCMGFMKCQDDYEVNKIMNAYKLLTSPDAVIQELALSELESVVGHRSTEPTSSHHTMDFLSSHAGFTKANQTVWSLARHGSRVLGVTWDYDDQQRLVLSYAGEKIEIFDTKLLVRSIREKVKCSYSNELMDEKKYALRGRSINVFAMSKFSNLFVIQCRDECDWQFIHNARLHMCRVRANPAVYKANSNNKKVCRNCEFNPSISADKKPDETLMHVLTNCDSNMQYVLQRHNCIIDLLKELFVKVGFVILREDEIFPEAGNMQRPDLLISNGVEAFIVDVVCPSDYHYDHMVVAAKRKKDKYKELAKKWLDANPKFSSLPIIPFAIGVRGAWFPDNDHFLKKIINSKSWREDFSAKCTQMVIRWSRCIFVAHMGGGKIVVENGYPKVVPR